MTQSPFHKKICSQDSVETNSLPQQYKSEPLKHIKEDDDSIYKFYQQSYLLKNPQFVESLRKSPEYLYLVESVENFLTELRNHKSEKNK